MIQRIQSILLAGVFIIAIILFFVPLSEKTVIPPDNSPEYKIILSLLPASNPLIPAAERGGINFAMLALNLLIMVGAVYTIFQFNNRPAQMKLCSLTGFIAGLLLVAVFYFSDNLAGEGEPMYLLGTYLIAVQVILLVGARWFIHKDEKLVRASNRIR